MQVRHFTNITATPVGRILDCAFNVSGALPKAVPTDEYLQSLVMLKAPCLSVQEFAIDE